MGWWSVGGVCGGRRGLAPAAGGRLLPSRVSGERCAAACGGEASASGEAVEVEGGPGLAPGPAMLICSS